MDYFDQEDEPDYFDFNPTYRIYQPMHNSEEIMYLQMDSIVCQKQIQTTIEYTTKAGQSKQGQNNDSIISQLNRSKTVIEVSDIINLDHQKIRKGWRRQTSNFGKFIRSQFLKQFKKIVLMQRIEQNQMEELKYFFNAAGSLKSFKMLFKSDKLSRLCSKIYNSISFIAKILKSENMHFRNKLTILKYFKNLQNLKEDEANYWKTAK